MVSIQLFAIGLILTSISHATFVERVLFEFTTFDSNFIGPPADFGWIAMLTHMLDFKCELGIESFFNTCPTLVS
jgi:hypothetical protein